MVVSYPLLAPDLCTIIDYISVSPLHEIDGIHDILEFPGLERFDKWSCVCTARCTVCCPGVSLTRGVLVHVHGYGRNGFGLVDWTAGGTNGYNSGGIVMEWNNVW